MQLVEDDLALQPYRVILTGYANNQDAQLVEENIARFFKITLNQARQVLNDVPKSLKENLTLARATTYQKAIENTGAKCTIENMRNDSGRITQE